MCDKKRIIYFFFIFNVFFQPFQLLGEDILKFKQNALSIATTLYGAFLIDQDGFMWIGTTGLSVLRHDGYKLKSFAASIQGSMISSIAEDKEGLIWISSFSKGITSYNKETGKFSFYRHNPNDINSLSSNNISFSPQKLLVDQSHSLWVGTDNKGLSRYNKTTGTWKHYKHNPNDSNSLSNNAVMAIAESRDGKIWVGTERGGLDRFDPMKDTWTHYKHDPKNPKSLSNNWINSILEDRDRVMWIGTKKGGLNRFDAKTGNFTRYTYDPNNPKSIGDNDVWSMYEDSSGGIWVTHMASQISGLDLFNKENGTFTRYSYNVNDPNSISSNSIPRVYQDQKTKTLWVLHHNGRIDRHDENTTFFRNWRSDPKNPNSLSGNTILPIIEDRDNKVWVGTGSRGLNRIDRETGIVTRYLPDPTNPKAIPRARVSALSQDSSGVLWVGFWDGILASLDRKTGEVNQTFRHQPDIPHSITESERLKYILEDRDDPNILWLATIKGGLDKFNKRNKRFTHFRHDPGNPNSLSFNSMPTLYDDGKGTLWIPTYGGGLDKFDKRSGTFVNYRHENDNPNSLGSNTLYEIIETTDGELWISRKGGISHFNPKTEKFKNFDRDENGVPFGPVSSILQDDNGILWLGTIAGGLIRFVPKTGATKRFTADDGLQGNTFFWTSRLKAKNGELWFGGSNGISSFFPSKIKNNPHIPSIALTTFTQGGTPVNTGKSAERLKEVTLDWRNNYFEFQFSALNFIAPEQNRYAYMLEGWDQDWYNSGSQPFGRYSGLQSGDYVLRLRGSNNDGVWNKKGTSIKVSVRTPFWNSIWFRIIGIVLCIFIIIVIFYYVKKLKTEIAERKKSEENLKYQQELFESIYYNIPIMITIFNPQINVMRVNKDFEKTIGWTNEDLKTIDLLEVCYPDPDYRLKAIEYMQAVEVEWREFNITTKSGEIVDSIWSNIKLSNETQIGIGIDITDRKKVEEALRESEEIFRSLAENSQDYIMRYDENGRHLYQNAAGYRVSGFTEDEFIGKTHRELGFDEELCNQWEEKISEVFQTGCPASSLISWQGTEGAVYIDWRLFPEFDNDGKVKTVLGVSRDVSDFKQAEDQIKTSLREKETLLHEIHHRVKNNMQVINSLLKLQANNVKDEHIKKILKDSQSRVYAMSAVHETLHGTEKLSEINLKTYLSKVTTSIFQTYSIDSVKTKLICKIDEAPISINQAYPLGLIINELMSNSLKYAFPEDKQGEINVSIGKLDKELELIVMDNGIGLPEEMDWKNSKSLGLKLVRTLVENQLDGSISLENSSGTKFTIKFNIAL